MSLIAFIGGGVLLDRVAGTEPILTLIGVALGLAAAGYELYELAQIGRSDRPAGPLGRRLTGAAPRRKPRPPTDERERDEE